MVCKKCGGSNFQVIQGNRQDVVAVSPLRKLGRSFLILCTGGFWWLMPKKLQTKRAGKILRVCVDCGYKQKI